MLLTACRGPLKSTKSVLFLNINTIFGVACVGGGDCHGRPRGRIFYHILDVGASGLAWNDGSSLSLFGSSTLVE